MIQDRPMIDASSSPSDNDAAGKDPRIELARQWHRVLALDQRLHSHIVHRYPRLLTVVEWILEILYILCANPIAALAVSLLLVPLVLSGSIPVIVWLSVIGAWGFLVLGFTRVKPLKQLSVAALTILVVLVAIILYWLSGYYVRWTLVNYYAHQEHPKVSTPVVSGLDGGAETVWNRIQTFLQEEAQRSSRPAQVRRSDFAAFVPKPILPPEPTPKNPYESLSKGELASSLNSRETRYVT